MKKLWPPLLLFLVIASRASAQEPTPPRDDTSSIAKLVNALYAVISGPAGARDWQRFHSLYHPSATMAAATVSGDGKPALHLSTPADYVRLNGPYFLEHSFYERELYRTVHLYGSVAQVFSTYESRIEGETKPERGINALQLVSDGRRWWILSITWQSETNALPLPAKYLPE